MGECPLKVSNLFRELSMMNIRGYSNLSDWQKDIFDDCFKNHTFSLSDNFKKHYTEEYIMWVKWDESNRRLEVRFKDDFYYYFPNRKWKNATITQKEVYVVSFIDPVTKKETLKGIYGNEKLVDEVISNSILLEGMRKEDFIITPKPYTHSF